MSLEFDDGLADQFQALSQLSRFGFHATFFVNSGRIGKAAHMTLSELVALAGAGDEIGGHTVDHVDLPALPLAAARHEVCDDRSALLALGLSAPDFAYPYGAVTPALERIVAACGYQSGRAIGHLAWARGCLGCPWAETIPPADRYATRTPISIHADTSLAVIESYVTTAQRHRGGWVQIVFHHVCTACNPYAITPLDLAALLRWLADRAGDGIAVRTAHEVIARIPHSTGHTRDLGGRSGGGSLAGHGRLSATVGWVRAQRLTTRSNCSIMRANSGGVIQLAFIHVRSSSVAPRATAHPFQT